VPLSAGGRVQGHGQHQRRGEFFVQGAVVISQRILHRTVNYAAAALFFADGYGVAFS
jgi:hypothetical protein